MNADCKPYTSEFGWSITMPDNWRRLKARHATSPAPVAVFSTPDNWSLSLSWMVSKYPVGMDAVSAFDSATMLEGRLDVNEATAVANEIFPLVGDIIRAATVTLPDGQRAIEIVETIRASESAPVEKVLYSLILPACRRGKDRSYPYFFQRLSFIAPPQEFNDKIAEVVKSARSFHYAERRTAQPLCRKK